MKTCKQCNRELIQTPGKRAKDFCGETCRSNFWYSQNKKGKKDEKKEPPKKTENKPKKETPAARSVTSNMAVKVVGAVKGKDAEIKPQTNPMPRTLDELKALCPPELTGLERSMWIANERQKYGI